MKNRIFNHQTPNPELNPGFKVHNTIELSKEKLLFNFDYLEKISGNTLLPVLKSNAYGHGIEQVAEILKERQFPYIAVNNYHEALRVRAVSSQPVLIMGAIDSRNADSLLYDGFTFMVQDTHFMEALGKTGKKLKIHIDIDTGMKRYGLDVGHLDQLLSRLKQLPNLDIEGVSTHLADGDNPEVGFTKEQVTLFDKAVEKIVGEGYKPKWVHISNTPGLLKVKSKYANSFRAGIGLYGINPLDPADAGYAKLQRLKPVLEVISAITFIRELKPGEGISYGRTWRAEKPTIIGVLPLGYYEGIPRSLSNKGSVLHGATPLPIVGRICMNHLMVDITGANLKVGDKLTVISANRQMPNSIEQMSQDFYFFSYGLLAKLNSDIRRVIVQ